MTKADLSLIFPRLYACLPKVVDVDVELSRDDSPVQTKFVGDLIIMYGLDTGVTYTIIAERNLRELGMSRQELHEVAVENLSSTQKEIRLHDGPDFSLIICDGNLEASLLLHEGIWDVVSDKFGGDIVVAVPARDVLLVTGTRKEQISALKKKTCEAIEKVDRPLSMKLFRRTLNGWDEFAV